MKNVVVIVGLFLGFQLNAQQVISLYQGKAPGSESWNWEEKETTPMPNNRMLYNVVEPTLIVYPAPKDKANGTSVIVAPGGAFHILSIDSEGIEVAKWLNERGITAFVFKYRVVRSLTDNPFQEMMPLMQDFKKLDEINAPVVEMAKNDGIEVMKYVKNNAAEMGLDPNKIGFMGFSAGGTVTISVMLSAPQGLKPNFIAPIYLYANAVLGNEMPEKMTPAFIAVASDDQLGFVPHSIQFYEKWSSAKHPTELHVYEKGGHGFGMEIQNTSSDHWTVDFENWLRGRGFIQ
ncbi:MAG: alpha/beta hydrolase [Algoriphagus sp.]|nr:alpha/beta hydrolase [Algoriphagus sp.]